jgi:Caspase domain
MGWTGRWVAAFALVVIGSARLIESASAEQRIALVVGNAAYVNVTPLTNSANDARLMAETLRGGGICAGRRSRAD